ncbi:MAG: F420-nonreducing hydrogenase [Desulfobacteraceae bacterium 4572_123]|nr:MAG: F420-nonreducing hydrogenase [Desulfobacteraceae bacterium 4572_123]
MRLQYPASVKIIRVPCTGKVDIIHLLHSFEKGADGVYVVGCMEGECHYNTGNFRARKHVGQARKILDTLGIGGQRVEMFNLSSGEGPTFARYAVEMTDRITKMGPNPIKQAKYSTKGRS